ncbi:cell envelope integrity protein TolA [Humidesulfovibrio idahonensis]
MEDSRRGTGFILSLVLHALLVTAGVLNFSFTRSVDMDKPMYSVDLVSLNPSEDPAEGETGEAAGGPPTLAEGQPEEKAAAATPVPPPPAPSAKPVPEPKRDDSKLISEKKVEEKKKPEKKEEKTPPAPPQPAEKKPSKEELLKQALQDVQKDVKDKSKNAKPTAKAADGGKDAVAGELAALRKSRGGNIFTAGGTGPGGAGGGKGTGAGGHGSGLMSSYGGIVTQIIKSHWRNSTFGRESNLVATLEINIDPQGKITGAHVVKSSGNQIFDASTVRAAMETQNLPPPVNKTLGTLHLNFNLQDMLK